MENEIDNNLLSAVVERRRDMLLAVADLARNALDETADYAGRGAVVDAQCTINVALARIRKELGCEAHETALDVGTRVQTAKRSCLNALAEDFGLKLSVFKTGKIRKYIGVRRTRDESPNKNNEHLFECACDREGHFEFFKDGEPFASVSVRVHKSRVEPIVCAVLRWFLRENVRKYVLRKKARAKNRVAGDCVTVYDHACGTGSLPTPPEGLK